MIKKASYKKSLLTAAKAFLLLGAVLLLTSCNSSARTREVWTVELLVTGKESTSRNGDTGEEEVYLIYGEDADGENQTFELTNEALAGKFEASEAFHAIKVDKSYKFGVGWLDKKREGQEGYYPSIYYSVSLNVGSENGEADEAQTDETEPETTEAQIAETESVKEESKESEETKTEDVEESTRETEADETEEGKPAEENTERVRESVEAELEESYQAEKESMEASLKESFQAEIESLEEELNRLREMAEVLQ